MLNDPSAVVVTGLAIATACGETAATWQAVQEGRTAIQLRQPIPDLPPWPLAMRGDRPADLERLLSSTLRAVLSDAQLTAPQPDCGVVIGSSRSHQGAIEAWLEAQAPAVMAGARASIADRWLDLLPGGPARQAARHLQSQGPVLAPMAACATGIWAIAQGADLIRRGECDRVVAGAIESPISRLTLVGFERMGALAREGCFPFDRDRQGLVLGEGAALLVLETAAAARSRGAAVYGQILGVGLTADGHHVSAPDPAQVGSRSAIGQSLQRSGLRPEQIGYVHAHGTSTVLNDRHEAGLLRSLFPAGVPTSSTKGVTGHTLGAAGAIGVALTLLALRDRVLPPCTGLCNPAFAGDWIREARTVDPAHLQAALCLSFGFGGQNGAIALAPWPAPSRETSSLSR
jgi:3-oxoacyl-[acyl-carrier-protein] synthase II